MVEETGATLMVGFNRRFDPDFRALKAAIDGGSIGTVEMVTLTSRDPGPPPYEYIERSGGIFRDMTIHDFDVARWLLGEEVETVQAAASVLVDPEIGRRGDYDSVNVILTTAVRPALHHHQFPPRDLRLRPADRGPRLGGHDCRVENVHQSRTMLANGDGLHPAAAARLLHDPLHRGLCHRDRGLCPRDVQTGTAPPTTGHDGLMALALADAALNSVERRARSSGSPRCCHERALDLITIGRSSVDLYGAQIGGRLEDMRSFEKYIGGSPTNIACGTARLGLRSAVITAVGDEHMGRFIVEQLQREGVDVRGVKTDPERLTALVLLGIRDENQFPLIFYRENCADMGLTEDDIDPAFIAEARAVVATGTHLANRTDRGGGAEGAAPRPRERRADRARHRLPPEPLGPRRPRRGREPLHRVRRR